LNEDLQRVRSVAMADTHDPPDFADGHSLLVSDRRQKERREQLPKLGYISE